MCALVLGAALVNAFSANAQSAPLRVSMFGDSVMLGARDALLSQFQGLPVTVDAVESRSLLGSISMFQANPAALGDVVVLDLGYNDMDDPGVFRERIDGAMGALSGVKHVIWLNQHEFEPGRAAMNAELTAAASRYPKLDVVDWNAEVNAHPDEVYGDAIHLTSSGQAAMARLVRQHFDSFVASLTPPTTVAAPAPSAPAPTQASAPSRAPAHSAHASSRGTDGVPADLPVALGIAAVVIVGGIAAATVSRKRRRARHA